MKMPMKIIYKHVIGLVLLILMQSCSVLPTPKPVGIEYFTIDVPTTPLRHEQKLAAGPVLMVARPQVRADLDTPRMAYRQQDYTLRYYARSRWADTPAQLLLPSMAEALEASGQFAAVLRTGSAATPELRLDTELLDFSQDYRTEPNQFQIRLHAQLTDLRTRRVIASTTFIAAQAASEQSPYAGAAAANAAWQSVLKELVEFCTQALPVAPAAND